MAGGKESRPPYVVAELDGNHDAGKGVEFRTLSLEAGKNTLTAANMFEQRYEEVREDLLEAAGRKEQGLRVAGIRRGIARAREEAQRSFAQRDHGCQGLFGALKEIEFRARRVTTINAFVIDADLGWFTSSWGRIVTQARRAKPQIPNWANSSPGPDP